MSELRMASGRDARTSRVTDRRLRAFLLPTSGSWHEAEMPKYLGDVRCWVNSGSHLLALSISEFDP